MQGTECGGTRRSAGDGLGMKLIRVKAVLSTLLILLFLCLVFTGALLYFGKTGVVLGISRHTLREIHFFAAVSMCVLIPVHLISNFRLYTAGLKALRRGLPGNGSGVSDKETGNEYRNSADGGQGTEIKGQGSED